MAELLEPDLCVIGAGSGGLSVAAAAAQLGVQVVLIERGKMGGDCLNYGCVPSKALIAAAKRAQQMRDARPFGIAPVEPEIDFARVHDHVQGVIAAIAPNDSVERFTGMGVQVIQAEARFKDKRTVEAGDYEIKARRVVIATGSSPAVPPIPGLERVPFFTNETIFDNTVRPDHLLIVGAGPIGMELAQAHRRLGCKVTVLEAATAMAKDDEELADVVIRRVRAEGVRILEGVQVERLQTNPPDIRVDHFDTDPPPHVRAHVTIDGQSRMIDATHLLIAAGRRPNLEALNLDAAGIKHGPAGIKVGKRLRTRNPRVYAIGDVAGGPQFTHVANYHAGLIVRKALFRLPAKVEPQLIPWVTYTAPELAQVGLTEEQAREKHKQIRVLRWPYGENDRAQAERETEGFVKVVTTRRGRILGAGIVGAQAGELIHMWTMAITRKLAIGAMTGIISPYPTLSEINKRVAYTYYLPSLTSPMLRRVIELLRKLG